MPSAAELEEGYKSLYKEFNTQSRPTQAGKTFFRLLKIDPSKPGDLLRCSLIAAELEDATYEALSYTWGNALPAELQGSSAGDAEWEDCDEEDGSDGSSEDRADSNPTTSPDESARYAVVNGHDVSIQSNLLDALLQLRSEQDELVIWADYLCINQNSLDDRAAQVEIMDRIYTNAKHVTIWLGLADADTEPALREVGLMATGKHFSELYSATGTDSKPITLARFQHIANLLRRRWFDRMWTIQEVVLPKTATVRVGSYTLPWSTFVSAAQAIGKHSKCCATALGTENVAPIQTNAIDNVRYSMASVIALESLKHQKYGLHEALRRCNNNRLCTDARDRVFAVLGIVPAEQRLVTPNYKIDVADVYKDAYVKIIESSKDLSVLMDLDEYAGDDALDLPWWCVDWSNVGVFGMQYWPLFRASGGYRTERIERCTPDTISLDGVIVDHVSRLVAEEDVDGDTRTSHHIIHDMLRDWEKAARLDRTGDEPYAMADGEGGGGSGTRRDAFWRTVLLGTNPQTNEPLVAGDEAAYKEWRAWLREYTTLPITARAACLARGMNDPSIRAHSTAVATFPAVRVFFETDDGYFGLGPVTLEEKDDVAVLAGGNVPFAVRFVDVDCDGEGCEADQSRCQMMGWCYVQGFMNGEATRSIEHGEERWRRFCVM